MYNRATVASTILLEALGIARLTFSLSAVNSIPIRNIITSTTIGNLLKNLKSERYIKNVRIPAICAVKTRILM